MKIFIKLLQEEQGMETVEWAVMAALIVAGLAAIVSAIGTHIKSAFTTLQTDT